MIARPGMWVLGVVAFVCTTDLLKMGNTLGRAIAAALKLLHIFWIGENFN